MSRRTWVPLGLAVLACLILPAVSAARATVGTSIDRATIVLAESVEPGQSRELPAIGVTNLGDGRTTYRVRVQYLPDREELRPPQGWLSFEPAEVSLEPSQTKGISPTLRVPTTAKPGKYFALLAVYAVPTANEGAGMSASAATKLNFEVVDANPARAIWNLVSDFVSTRAPWSCAVLAIPFVVLALVMLLRRFEFSVKRRRPPGSE